MREVSSVLLVVVLAAACTDVGPTDPTSTVVLSQVSSGPVPAGTVLSVRSAETGLPVAEAEVLVAGSGYQADSSGQVVLGENFAPGSLVDVLNSAYLERQTVLHSPGANALELWPRSSPTGLTEDFTYDVVYTTAASGEPRALMRIAPNTREVHIVPSAPIANDPEAMRAAATAAASISEITGGAIEFIVREGPVSTNGVVINLIIDPEDAAENDAVALARRRMRGHSIIGGSVIYASIEVVRSSTTTHELGHMYGLGHSSGARDVMNTHRNRSHVDRFSAREALVMNLMLKRPPGNVRPDNDRDVSGQNLVDPGAGWTSVVVCRN